MRHEAPRTRTTARRRRGAAEFLGIAAAAALMAGCTTTDDAPEDTGAGAESHVEHAEGSAQTENGTAGGHSDDDGDAGAGSAAEDANNTAEAETEAGAGSDDEYADMTEIERWWVDLQQHYEDREDVLTISSTPSGRETTHEFDEPVTVQSLELYCYGDTDLAIEVALGEAGEAGSVQEDITCAEGLHEVDLGQAGSAGVDVIEVRSAPAIDADHRHYVAVLGSAN